MAARVPRSSEATQSLLPFGVDPPDRGAAGLSRDPGAFFDVREPLLVRNPRARRYVLRVGSNGQVRITLPRWGSRREALAFADSQRTWVERQRQRLLAERASRSSADNAFEAADISDLRARARRELPGRLRALAERFGLTVSRISIRNQRWRWGSCSPSGHICLNWRLIGMPDWVADYVMIHELMHLKQLNHSKRFWKLVAAACPAWQEARAWLRQAGRSM